MSERTILDLPLATTEYVRVPITERDATGAVDPTGNVVEFSLTAHTATSPGSWVVGSWEAGQTEAPFYARILVGTGGDLDPGQVGTFRLWVRVTDYPEAPIRKAGIIRFA